MLRVTYLGTSLSVSARRVARLTADIPKDAPGYTKAELEALVHKHGGDFTQAQLADNSAFVISVDDKCKQQLNSIQI
jgi:DNA ligase-4